MKNKNIKSLVLLISAFGLTVFACKKAFLERPPNGSLSDVDVTTQQGAEELLIGAYALLDGVYNGDDIQVSGSNHLYGSVRGGDAHKGSNAGDAADANPIERYTDTPVNSFLASKWISIYEAITRCNNTIRAVNKLTADQISDANRTRILAEAKFLRGHYHFEAKKMWGNVPYIDETISYDGGNYKVPNNVDILPKIEADLTVAWSNLPATGLEIGRANKWAAGAMLAKCYLFEKKFADAKPLLENIIANGTDPTGDRYALAPNFHYNFNVLYENGKGYDGTESVFAIQASVNDGGGGNNANYGDILDFPYSGSGAPGGCCGFFQPSFELANAYRTTVTGLPLLDGSYNTVTNQLKTDEEVAADAPFTPDAGNLDPRLDWTVGRRSIPYLDWGPHPGISWIRDQANAGPYSPKKNAYYKSQTSSYTDGNSWTSGLTALNVVLIRFADVILWAAECEVEVGSLEQARTYVNQIRTRAANPAGYVLKTDGTPAANYVMGLYAAGAPNDPFSSQASAKQAVHFERKLELAMEGHRFFDLVRWGEAANTLNAYLAYEKNKVGALSGNVTYTAGHNDYYQIPQRQIDLMGSDVLKQNP